MAEDHESVLRDWKDNAAKQDEKNFRFVRSLKMVDDPEGVDGLARELHEDAFNVIDCTRCANCCKTMPPMLTEDDVERISAHLGTSPEAFIEKYLKVESAPGMHRVKEAPCVFLGEDDHCTIYDVRPEECREFPHTDKDGFIWRTYVHSANTLNCPAVYYVVKRMRQRLRRR